MAERIATTPTDDTLARALLACRLDDVHAMTATHRLRKEYQSEPRPIRTVPLQSYELAENSQNEEPLAKLLGLAAWRSPQFSW